MTLYFKIESHEEATNHNIFNIAKTQYQGSTKNYVINDYLINNYWYNIDDFMLKNGLTTYDLYHLIVDSGYFKGFANYDTDNNSYNMAYQELYVVKNKNQNAQDGTYGGRALSSETLDKGYGDTTYPFKMNGINNLYSYKFNTNSNDMYLIYCVGNYRSAIHNTPIFIWNGLNLGFAESGFRRYSTAIDTTTCFTGQTSNIKTFQDYTGSTIKIYKDGNLVKTVVSPKKNDVIYTVTPQDNDIYSFKEVKTEQQTQPQPTQPQPTQPQPTQPKKPDTINLPTIEHITFNPTKLTGGQVNKINVAADDGYKIDKLKLKLVSRVGLSLVESSLENNILTLDLTKYFSLAGKELKHYETITPIEKPKQYLKIPQLEGVNFTISDISGTHKVTQLEIGKTTNIGIELDKRYTWNDENKKGKGLVYTNQNTGNDVALGYWQGNTSYLVDLTKVTNPNWLYNLRWEFNYHKYLHDDEHNKKIPLTLNLQHCTTNVSEITENTTTLVTLTADTGYIFNADIICYSYNSEATFYNRIINKANNKNVITVSISVGSYADFNKDDNDPNSYPSITAVAVATDAKPTGTQALNLYDMTDGELNTFMNSIITEILPTTDGDSGINHPDFQQFVNQVYRIPFDIPKDKLTTVNKVKSGKWHIDVNTHKINDERLIVKAGNIKITPTYNNANDYSPITCKLYLPFAKEVTMDISDLLNHTINITYDINLLTGSTTVIINNEDGNIFTNQFNISTSLEFYGLYYTKTVGHLNSTFINDILQAYVKLTYRKPIPKLVSYETQEHGTLKDYTGFTRVSNLAMKTTKENYSESNEINQLLRTGVIINDTKGN